MLSEMAEFLYKTTDHYASEYERSICWDDLEVGIKWPFSGEVTLALKDRMALLQKMLSCLISRSKKKLRPINFLIGQRLN